jgi:hypothetical protein
MTFETWAKELLCRELKKQGTMVYIRKPRERQGWYCTTENGFLLHVEAEKISFGFFRINYEIMPLVGRITEAVGNNPPVSMGMNYDVAHEYLFKFGRYSPDHKSLNLRSKCIGESETDETVIDMIRNYLNPLFDSLLSYEDYCKDAIEIMVSYRTDVDRKKKKEVAKMLYENRHDIQVEMSAELRKTYPADFPWYAQRINQMPYVYAFLGKYEEALAWIHGIRHARLEVSQYNYEHGYSTENDHLQYKQILEEEDREIEVAMQTGDTALVQEILLSNYQRNRTLIRERIGLEFPECPVAQDRGRFACSTDLLLKVKPKIDKI